MKKLIIIALLSAAGYSQTTFGVLAGINSFTDICATSETGLEGSIQFIQGINHSLLARATVNAGTLKNDNIPYDTDYIIGNLDLMINAGRLLDIKDHKYQILPFFGAGYGRIENQNLANMHAGILQRLKITDRAWLSLELGRRGYISADALGGHQSNVKGISAIQDYALLGLTFDFIKRKQKTKAIPVEKVIVREITPQVVYQDCNNCKDNFVIPLEHVFFREGKCDIDQSELNAITNMFEFMERNPNTKLECVGSSCSNQGSDKRNFELSECRAKIVHDKLISMGLEPNRVKYRGTGKDKKYSGRDSDVQKRVSFIIYK